MKMVLGKREREYIACPHSIKDSFLKLNERRLEDIDDWNNKCVALFGGEKWETLKLHLQTMVQTSENGSTTTDNESETHITDDPESNVLPMNHASTATATERQLFGKTLWIHFSLQVLRKNYSWKDIPKWFWEEGKLTEADCKRNSPQHIKIVTAIHQVFADLVREYCPERIDELQEIHVHPPKLVNAANHLSFVLQVENADGTPISKKYKYYDKPASLDLWNKIETVLKEAANFESFETKVDLVDWLISSIIMLVNITKNVNCLWTAEEIDTFLDRAIRGMHELQLEPPLRFVSITTDKYLRCQIDISSPSEEFIDVVQSFLHLFERRLVHRSTNGDPNFTQTSFETETSEREGCQNVREQEGVYSDYCSNKAISTPLDVQLSDPTNELKLIFSLKRVQKRFRQEDCGIDSPLFKSIKHKIIETFELQSKNYHINFELLKFKEATNHLLFELIIKTKDVSPIPEAYYLHITPESMHLWDLLKDAISKASQLEDYDVKIELETWTIG